MSSNKNSISDIITTLGVKLSKELLEHGTSSQEKCSDIVESLNSEMSKVIETESIVAILESTRVGKMLSKAVRTMKRHQRSMSSSSDQQSGQEKEWQILLSRCEVVLNVWKSESDKEYATASQGKKITKANNKKSSLEKEATGLPSNAEQYKHRLVLHKKEIYKNPPALPPPEIVVETSTHAAPTRRKNGDIVFEDWDNFRPNRSPEEVLRVGAFGGTYFRSITSSVNNVRYTSTDVLNDTVLLSWIHGLEKRSMLTSQSYDKSRNKYKVKCGGSLGMWESSGWISNVDPYGWFQWYCRFYQGRRCSDDARQISRWAKSAGPTGRFRSQLCNKCIRADTNSDDSNVSPVIRQTLLHWGFELTANQLEFHRQKKK
mmetsp:Transcript_25381/g.31218  ORF Transcript_25381/g.31218 Transcript_25381/m.31218 type:complete len:374 (-) Transcript_25381:192-1313(-)